MHWCGSIWHDIPMFIQWSLTEGLTWLQSFPMPPSWHKLIAKFKQKLLKEHMHGCPAQNQKTQSSNNL